MYTIKQGDTLYAIAKSLNTTVAAIEAANPGIQPSNLQIGASIKIPAGSGGGLQTHQPVSQATQYTIQQGDTFYVIASRVGIPIEAIESSNPGVDPSKLQVGQVINVPQNAGPVPGPSVTVIPNPGGNYVSYSGSSSNFPHPQHWAPYHALWHHNSALMRHRNTSQQIAHIGRAIEIASSESGIDPRIILCLIMQESGGHVAVPDTFSRLNFHITFMVI
jgi:LysM repeat protein